MKKYMFCLSLLTALVAFDASGQSLGNGLKATVPFDFIAAGQRMPAGDYFVSNATNTVLQIVSLERKARILVPSNAIVQQNDYTTQAKLVFNRYGDHAFLSRVWTIGDNRGYEFKPSKLERELAARARPTGSEVIASRNR